MATIIRGHEARNFTTLGNHVIRDRRLSWRATGILAFLLSLPPDARVDSTVLWQERREGRDVVRSALREIEGAGYLRRPRRRDARGRWVTEWVVTSDPSQPDLVDALDGMPAARGLARRSGHLTMDRPPRRLRPVDNRPS